MKPDFRPFAEAAEFLGQTEQKYIIEQTERSLNDGTYFVAFVGHYSAGKSRLINNLLDRDLLPLGVAETTPLLTYIRYGEREEARVHYCDAAVQVIPVEQVKELRQGSSAWDLDKLEYIEIFLPEECLRGGMIFVDTPGANTVIERHRRLLSDSLALASKVVYVAGHAISAVDEDMLETLAERGLDLSFVRTHFDELKAQEDDPDSVIQSDLNILSRFGLAPESCLHLSNLQDSKWYGGIENLRKVLEDTGNHAQEELARAAEEKLRSIAGQFIPVLEERRAVLEALRDNDGEALRKKRCDLERRIQSIEQNVTSRKERVQARLAQYRRRLSGEISRRAKEELEESSRRIANADDVKSQPEMSALLGHEVNAWTKKLNKDINALCGDALAEINRENAEIICSVDIDENAVPAIGTCDELIDTQDRRAERLRYMLQQIAQNRNEIEASLKSMENGPVYAELQKELTELENGIEELRQQYDSFPAYEPQMVESVDGFQPSQLMRMLGDVADLALLFAPGASPGAVVNKLATSSKIVKPLAKLIGYAEKMGKEVQKGNSIKDITFANMGKTYATKKRIKQAQQMIQTGTENVKKKLAGSHGDEGTPLDFLTVGYWAEKIGKQFDTPPQPVDKAYEEQYIAEKSAIEQKILKEQQKAFQKKREMRLFKDRQSQLEAERKANELDEKRVREELAKREGEIRLEAQKKANHDWRQSCALCFVRQMTTVLENAISKAQQELPERIDLYQQEQIAALEEKLQTEKQAYETMLQAPPSEYAERLEEVGGLLERLKAASHAC